MHFLVGPNYHLSIQYKIIDLIENYMNSRLYSPDNNTIYKTDKCLITLSSFCGNVWLSQVFLRGIIDRLQVPSSD